MIVALKRTFRTTAVYIICWFLLIEAEFYFSQLLN